MEKIKQNKHKFNFVDAIIILVIAAALALIGYVFFFGGNGNNENVEIYYAVECPEVKTEFVSGFNIGDKFVDITNDHCIGEAVDITIGDREFVGVTSDGHAVATNHPSSRSVMIVIKANAVKEDYDYKIDDYYKIQVGTGVNLNTAALTSYGYCVALTEVENDADKEAFVQRVKNMIYTAEVKSEEDGTNE